jgi:HK97 family phage prohead protease
MIQESMKQQLERRMIVESVASEQREDGVGPVIQGYAALFDVSTEIGGWFTESIRQGAFARAIKEGDDCRCLFNHNPDYLLGRTKSGTLRLNEDPKGLWIENIMPDTQMGRDVMKSIERGDVTGQSFAFVITKQEWRFATEKGQLDHREIVEVQLYDVGPVVYPAYEQTSIAARGNAEEAYKLARAEWEKSKEPEAPVVITFDPSIFELKVRCLRATL